jgi:transposase
MYIESVPNRDSPPAILLRESYREDGKVKKRTLCNLSDWPPELVAGLRTLLKGGAAIPAGKDPFVIRRTLPHGHVAAALGVLRRIKLDTLIGPKGHRLRDLIVAMIVARVISPGSKLATAKALDPRTGSLSLAEVMGLGAVDEDELYTALDWLIERQPAIETALAKRHLQDGTLVLYDVSSSYVTGRCCDLARIGYSRDGKKGTLQIVYGVLCNAEGCPVAVEVFEGNTADPKTLSAQITKLKDRFGLTRVVLVGDRGMITEARIRDEIAPAGLDWITALRAPAIKGLVDGGTLQLSLFDDRDMAAITSPEFPGERLVVCKNHALAAERHRKRADLLAATERDLRRIQAKTVKPKSPLQGAAAIGIEVGAVLNHHKMGKHFDVTITDTSLTFVRRQADIEAEAALDGLYAVRTNLASEVLDDSATVRAYKSLSRVERAFRCLKTVDLHVRPIHHWLAGRVKAHVFLCMLAYHVEWHMRQLLAPMLYHDDDKDAAEAMRNSVVAKAERSPSARAKETTGVTPDGLPVHSFQSLMADLGTLALNRVVTPLDEQYEFTVFTKPTDVQAKAFRLLGIEPERTQ